MQAAFTSTVGPKGPPQTTSKSPPNFEALEPGSTLARTFCRFQGVELAGMIFLASASIATAYSTLRPHYDANSATPADAFHHMQGALIPAAPQPLQRRPRLIVEQIEQGIAAVSMMNGVRTF